jgi:hypothetical protein
VSSGATPPLWASLRSAGRVGAVGLRQVHGGPPPAPGLPDPAAHRRRVHAQRPGDLPHRLARPHQPHRLDPNRWRRARPRPATAEAARPTGGPGAFCLGVGPPPLPPVPRCVLPSAGPAELGWAGRVPVGIAVLCPTGLPVASVGVDPVAAVGVGGWAASHASTAAIASVCSCARRRPASPPSSCTSMVNPGGPGRGRRPRLRC